MPIHRQQKDFENIIIINDITKNLGTDEGFYAISAIGRWQKTDVVIINNFDESTKLKAKILGVSNQQPPIVYRYVYIIIQSKGETRVWATNFFLIYTLKCHRNKCGSMISTLTKDSGILNKFSYCRQNYVSNRKGKRSFEIYCEDSITLKKKIYNFKKIEIGSQQEITYFQCGIDFGQVDSNNCTHNRLKLFLVTDKYILFPLWTPFSRTLLKN